MDYSKEGLAKADRQYDQLKALEQLRDKHLQRLVEAQVDRIQLEGVINDLSEAQAAVSHSRRKLNELCQP